LRLLRSAQLVTPRAGCVYCGEPCCPIVAAGRVLLGLTCSAHADLPALDPSYGLVRTLALEAYPALSLDDAYPSRLRREPA
jgi:hypothetical protein